MLQDKLLSTTQQQFGEEQGFFQHEGATWGKSDNLVGHGTKEGNFHSQTFWPHMYLLVYLKLN